MMRKSVLLTGKPASGKTRKIKELLAANNNLRCAEMSFEDFKDKTKASLQQQFDVIAIDEVETVDKINYLSAAISGYGFKLIVATQIGINELEPSLLSNFDVFKLR